MRNSNEGYRSPLESARPENEFNQQETVNGTEISVGWDGMYRNYSIYFPQVELNEEAQAKGVGDQVISISENPEDAKSVFEYAKKLAETETNINEIYLKVQDFCQNL